MNASSFMESEFVFPKEFEYYCFKNCYWNLLKYYGVESPELFLDCGIEWLFTEDGSDKYGYSFSTGDFFSSFLPSWAGQAHFHSNSDNKYQCEEIWESNRLKLMAGVPLIAGVDVFELDYTPFYHKKHSYHSLLLTGYEERTEQYQLIDWYPPWFFKGERTQALLDPARSSANQADGILSGNPIDYLWVEVEREGWTAAKKHQIDEALSLCLDQFYSSPEERGNAQRGVYALHALLETIEKMMEETKGQKEFMEDLHGKLFFTAPRKSFLKFYLKSAAREWPSSKLYGCIKCLEDTITEWKKLSSIVIKASLSERTELFQQVIDLLRRQISLEKNFYYELYSVSKSLKVEGFPIWI
ncbi:BtrH N-terminal domain-containing protein [Paenibacillus sp. FSL H8-0122]|uniref:BtrH N-terminal domain-containing protein n=1 Tax=unclassified Paenibacillus TaxID=185978 RepID=UPI0030F9FEF5